MYADKNLDIVNPRSASSCATCIMASGAPSADSFTYAVTAPRSWAILFHLLTSVVLPTPLSPCTANRTLRSRSSTAVSRFDVNRETSALRAMNPALCCSSNTDWSD